MKKRLLTGIVYLLVLIGFYAARLLCRDYSFGTLIFDALILLFSVAGTFEICRALGERIDRIQRIFIQVFSAGIIVCYAVSDAVYKYLQTQSASGEIANHSTGLTFVVFMAGVAVLCSLLVFRYEKTSFESVGYSFLAFLYPSVFLLVLSGVNHMPQYSEVGLLFVFAICPFADCFAFVFGMLLKKKLPKKMAPNVSPNKTVIGGIGGLIGGAIGAVCVFFAYYGLIMPVPFHELDLRWTNLIFFIGLGVLAAAFAELGDLAESAIKRKIGIKDMGKLLPGHGGVLDRIDSSLYASLIVCFVLVIRIMTTG